MATTGRATVSGSVPTIIVRELLLYTMPNLVMLPLVTRADKWQGGENYGDTIQIPSHLTRLGVTQLNTGIDSQSAEASPPSVSFSTPTNSNVQLLLSQYWYSAFQISFYHDAVAGLIDWHTVLKQSALDSLNVKIDATLSNLLAFSTNVEGSDNVDTQISDLLATKKDLDVLDVPPEDRAWVLSASEVNNWLNQDVLINQLYVGQTNVVTKGKFGAPVYGASPNVTTNLTAGTAGKVGGYFHRQAVAIAIRKEPFAVSLMNPNTASAEMALFSVWGVKVLRDNFGVKVQTK